MKYIYCKYKLRILIFWISHSHPGILTCRSIINQLIKEFKAFWHKKNVFSTFLKIRNKNLMFQAFQRPWSLPDFENAGTSLNLSVSLKFLLSYGETQATTKRPQQNSTNTLPSTCWSNLVQIRSDRHILAYLGFGACINSKPQIRKSQYSAYKLVIIS